MLQTRYEVKFPIDSKEFTVFFAPLNSTQLEEINELYKKSTEKFKKSDKLKVDSRFKKELFNINNESLRTLDEALKNANDKEKTALLKEKTLLLKEQKDLVKEIGVLKAGITEEIEKIGTADEDAVNIEEKQFDMCISGDDKEKVRAIIEKSSLTYAQVLNTISNVAAKESEKK